MQIMQECLLLTTKFDKSFVKHFDQFRKNAKIDTQHHENKQ